MNDQKLTAIVFGASGLTGRFITEHLIADQRYDTIKLFVRSEINIPSRKVKEIKFNPDNLDLVEQEISGDHLFCCIGTTIKKAGSREKFYQTDHNLVEMIAKKASANKVKSFVVISSIGANDRSGNFYLQTKGKMEESITTFTFNNLSIVRPSMLMGLRHENRPMEEVGKVMSRFLAPLMIGKLKKYKPVHASTVAKAMIDLANRPKATYIMESDEIEQLVNKL